MEVRWRRVEMETDSPLTIVTVSGAPLPEKSATVG